MYFNAKDFNGNKFKFYEGVGQRLAAIYREDLSVFGPEKTASYLFPGRDDSILSVDKQIVKEKDRPRVDQTWLLSCPGKNQRYTLVFCQCCQHRLKK